MVLILLTLVAVVLGFLLALLYWGLLVALRPVLDLFKRKWSASREGTVRSTYFPSGLAVYLNSFQQTQLIGTGIYGTQLIGTGIYGTMDASSPTLPRFVVDMTASTFGIVKSGSESENQESTPIPRTHVTELAPQRVEGAAA